MTASDDLYYAASARSDSQRKRMEELEAAGICIFCPANVAEHQPEPVEFSGQHWYVVKNAYPYVGTAVHYLIVPHAHIRTFDELPDEAGSELWAIKRKLKQLIAPMATASVERSGDMRYNGGSVAHYHVHFVVPQSFPSTPVRFRVSSHPADSEDG